MPNYTFRSPSLRESAYFLKVFCYVVLLNFYFCQREYMIWFQVLFKFFCDTWSIQEYIPNVIEKNVCSVAVE
jgi:hypothetical protein